MSGETPTTEPEMKLFAVQFDNDEDFVEAVSMRDAITVWHIHMKLQNGADWCGDEEPDACRLVSGKAVLRRSEREVTCGH